MSDTPLIESFSSDYAIVQDATVRTWREDEAHMDAGLYKYLEEWLGEPIVGMIDGLHYEFIPSTQVLSKEVAIPKQNRAKDPSVLLVMK